MDKDEIRKEVARVLDKLPRQFRKQLHNVEVVVEEWPGEELFLDAGLDPEQDTLYGLYRGVDLTQRSRLAPVVGELFEAGDTTPGPRLQGLCAKVGGRARSAPNSVRATSLR